MEKLLDDKEVRRIKRTRLIKARSDVRQAISEFVRRGTKRQARYAIFNLFVWRRMRLYTLVDYGSYVEYQVCIDEFGRLRKNYYWHSIRSFSADELESILPKIKAL